MSSGKVVTLDEKDKYLILLKTEHEQQIFYYTNKLGESENATNEYEIFVEVKGIDGVYLEEVTDMNLRKFLEVSFSVELNELVEELN